ncbi:MULTISPECIES: M23 family metallopeptidase [Spirulina sp. CCY15215]|uniref:M23 family metallopeptidase n=1 Tax=Spirulina sp. CCY15215 TaxID=2767591 RepID=UPI001951DEA7|nr:M23 family metallopeptidase [Spirulina major]
MTQNSFHRLGSLLSGITAGILACAAPVLALDVRVNPSNPQLGDTISVFIEVDNPGDRPQVMMGDRAFPAFPLRANLYRAFIPTTPLDRPGSLNIQISGDGQTRNLALALRDRSFNTQRIRVSGGGNGATQIELDRVAAFKALVTPEKFWNGALLKPTSGGVSSVFGLRRYYNGVFANDYYHRGVDYAAGTGTPVIAPAAGRIALVGRESQGFKVHGNTVGIDHGQGVLSIMLHLHRIDVREGEMVKAGQRIGSVGSTGSSTGPHLHWGLYVNGVAIDPVPWRFEGLE